MYIIIFILLGLIALLAVQNTTAIVVHFLFWQFHLPIAVVVLITLLVGLTMGMLYVQISAHRELSKRDEAMRAAEGDKNRALMELQMLRNEMEAERNRARAITDGGQRTIAHHEEDKPAEEANA